MSSKNTNIGGPVEKRGGMRRPLRRKPSQKENPQDIFKQVQSQFPKKLTQYRYMICTDMSPKDLLFLELYAAWLKVNEKVIDKGSHFPIYGFVTPNSTDNKVRAQRIREYLGHIGYVMGWDDHEHHLYKGFEAAGNRIWYDDSMTPVEIEGEHQLLVNAEAIKDQDYPDCVNLTQGLLEMSLVKPSNLMFVNLCELAHVEFNKYAEQCVKMPSATQSLMPLTDTSAKKLFKMLDESGDEDYGTTIRKAMFVYNDHALEVLKRGLSDEYKKVDWDDYNSFKMVAEAHPQAGVQEISQLMRNGSRSLDCGTAQRMLLLLGCKAELERALCIALKLF